jgi:SAM-dependent methyltransferase
MEMFDRARRVWRAGWRGSSGGAREPDAGTRIHQPQVDGAVANDAASREAILNGLRERGFDVRDYEVDVSAYHAYVSRAGYSHRHPQYYPFAVAEKSLEHFIAADLLRLQADDVYIDIASEHSPVPEIYERLFQCRVYRQDLAYPPGLHGDTIGGDAAALPIASGFASKVALHCSFEHFEADTDERFVRELGRVLRPGGAACIVPLYLFDRYAIQTDPAISAGGVDFDPEATIYYAPGWNNRHGRFYDPERLDQRIRKNLAGLEMVVYRIANAAEVDPSCYVEFAAVFRRPA